MQSKDMVEFCGACFRTSDDVAAKGCHVPCRSHFMIRSVQEYEAAKAGHAELVSAFTKMLKSSVGEEPKGNNQ